MIKTLIKRDGTREPLMAEKVNGWGEWAAANLGDSVDWTAGVMKTVSTLPEECTTQELQHSLIRYFAGLGTSGGNRMAGRLYAATIHKDFYGKDFMPPIKEVQRRLVEVGFMKRLDYSDEEYLELEKVIDHQRDFDYAHSQLFHIRFKYALRNQITGQEFESPQYVFMRMAMALADSQPKHRRIEDAINWYNFFSQNKINAPTPNYTNLGTNLNGYASCCLYAVDDTAMSLAVGDHIAYVMTVMSAGIGNVLMTRSLNDPVRGGLFAHRGKLPYLRSMQGAVAANIKNGRNGACTSSYMAFDPEVHDLQRLKNPMTVTDKQIRGMDYNMQGNKFLGRKAATNQSVFLFNKFTAPDLFEAFYGKDLDHFIELYEAYEANPDFKKTYVPARDIIISAENEAYETGRSYLSFMDEINRHTPYKDPIRTSNLCVEITEPVEPYQEMQDLYTNGTVGYIVIKVLGSNEPMRLAAPDTVYLIDQECWESAQNLKLGTMFRIGTEDRVYTVTEVIECKREPEVAMCSLGAIVKRNVSDEEYEKVMYYTLLMIDKCIHMSDYPLPHVGYTAKNRMAAGVGITSLADHLAKLGLNYTSEEGKREIHRAAELHMYCAIKASLRLGKELGNAPWIHRTKWAEGWVPTHTYNRAVDTIVPGGFENQFDWDALSEEIKENKGIRNSALVADMPVESSSKASGGVNSVYPARDKSLIKTDNGITINWTVPDSSLDYQLAWDVPTKDLIEDYAIIQKWTDQAISADEYRRISGSEKITTDEMLQNYFLRCKYGQKTRYYLNTKTAKQVVLDRPGSETVSKPNGVITGIHHENMAAESKENWNGGHVHEGLASVAAPSFINQQEQIVVDTESVVYNTTGDDGGCADGVCKM
jgi:ribonucleoside-diphosphate reductase alpha chain